MRQPMSSPTDAGFSLDIYILVCSSCIYMSIYARPRRSRRNPSYLQLVYPPVASVQMFGDEEEHTDGELVWEKGKLFLPFSSRAPAAGAERQLLSNKKQTDAFTSMVVPRCSPPTTQTHTQILDEVDVNVDVDDSTWLHDFPAAAAFIHYDEHKDQLPLTPKKQLLTISHMQQPEMTTPSTTRPPPPTPAAGAGGTLPQQDAAAAATSSKEPPLRPGTGGGGGQNVMNFYFCKPAALEAAAAAEEASPVCSGNGGGSDDTRHKLKRKQHQQWPASQDGDMDEEDDDEEEEESLVLRSCATRSTTRSRTVHSLTELKRRDKINKKLCALRELIPNCNKADKATILDKAIEYLKTLQLQLQMMSMGSGVCNPAMLLPLPAAIMQQVQVPQMAHFPQMGTGYTSSYGMGMGLGLGVFNRNNNSNFQGCPMLPLPSMPMIPPGAPGPSNAIPFFAMPSLATRENLPPQT